MNKKFYWVISCLFISSLFPFIWKGKEKDLESKLNKWIYVENLDKRVITFLEFENYTKNRKKDFDSFKQSIPRTIAQQFKNIKELELPFKDFIPVFKNVDKYQIFKLNFTNAHSLQKKYGDFIGKTQYELSKLFNQQISLTNNILLTNTITNQTKKDQISEKNDFEKKIIEFLIKTKVAYVETNKNKYTFYGYKEVETTYLDAQLIDVDDLPQIEIPLYTNENGIRYFIYEKNKPKKLILKEKLYSFNIPLKEVVKKIPTDYLVYGKYKAEGINFFLDIFVIHKKNRTIKNVYSKKLRQTNLKKEIKQLSHYIIAYLEGKELVENVVFESRPKGASLYLNNKFQGKMPLKFDVFVKKKFNYRVFLDSYQIEKIETDFPGDKKTIDINRSNGQVIFTFLNQKKEGDQPYQFKAMIKNNIPSDFYLNTDLMATQKTNFSQTLYPGDYYLSVSNKDYLTKNFKIEIKEGQNLDLDFNLKPIQDDWINNFFFNHSRNVKIFSILGFLFGTSTIGVYLHTLDLEDKRNEVDRRLTTLNSSVPNYNDLLTYRNYLSQEYDRYAITSAGLLGGSLLSFISALFAHYFDIWEERISLESEFKHSSDTKFNYKASIKF